MYQIDFGKPEHIHFIGIGGISMSGLAEILMDEGFTVSGSDAHRTELTEALSRKGARVFYGQRASNVTDGIRAVVYTAAIHEDNPELTEVRRRGIPALTRAELLGQLMKNYGRAIAVAGTHGKTTTTSMIAEILLAADTDPTVSVGGVLRSIGGNIRVGGSDLFVAEACEYTNSFLSFYPNIEVILNIEEDHLDFFKDLEDIRNSFRQFARLVPADGINKDIERLDEIVGDLPCRIVTFGRSADADYWAENVIHDEFGRARFDVVWREGPIKAGEDGGAAGTEERLCRRHIVLDVPGEHNVNNALAAIAVCRQIPVSMEAVCGGLARFTGADRRFQVKGRIGGVTIVDDYAHHPSEIRATLEAARNYPHRKLWCVFQPHTYSRTKAFLSEFAQALSAADEVILAEIYAARETDDLGISSADIAERVAALGTPARSMKTFDEIEKFILKNCVNGDLLITMGAGDVVNIGEELLKG